MRYEEDDIHKEDQDQMALLVWEAMVASGDAGDEKEVALYNACIRGDVSGLE